MAPVSPKSRMRKMREKKGLDPEKWKVYKVSEASKSRAEYIKKKTFYRRFECRKPFIGSD